MFYKFRSLDNFQFVLDIIVNQRLYAASLDTMNDPMEGFYTHESDMPEEAIIALEEHKKSLKFSSLTMYDNNPLMWAHYANGCRGVAIGVEFKDGVDFRNVIYGTHSQLSVNKPTTLERAKRVLSYKSDFWHYEDEVRVFADKGNYVSVVVKKVVIGERADRSKKSLLKKIVSAVNPTIQIQEWDEEKCYVHSQPIKITGK